LHVHTAPGDGHADSPANEHQHCSRHSIAANDEREEKQRKEKTTPFGID